MIRISCFTFAGAASIGSVFLLNGASALHAQDVDVQAAVACFEAKLIDDFRDPEFRTNPQCKPGVLAASAYLRPSRYDQSTIEAVLNGLERLAMTTSNGSVRIGATSSIAAAGQEPTSVFVVPWLARLFRDAPTPDVKVTALNGLRWLTDRQAAAEALGEIAAEIPAARPVYGRSYPAMAVDHLRFMGPEGRAVLQRLLTEDRILDAGIKSQVSAAIRSLERPPD
jgi:hypothetical protein